MLTTLWAVLASAVGAANAPPPAPLPNLAIILNTGSTNTAGYSISVQSSGQALYMTSGRQDVVSAQVQHGQVAKTLASKLFHDLAAAKPLTKLPVTFGMKSVSFGTSTYITYNGQRTPDLSMPADARGQALKADVAAIAAALHLRNGPRRPGPAAPPQAAAVGQTPATPGP